MTSLRRRSSSQWYLRRWLSIQVAILYVFRKLVAKPKSIVFYVEYVEVTCIKIVGNWYYYEM